MVLVQNFRYNLCFQWEGLPPAGFPDVFKSIILHSVQSDHSFLYMMTFTLFCEVTPKTTRSFVHPYMYICLHYGTVMKWGIHVCTIYL